MGNWCASLEDKTKNIKNEGATLQSEQLFLVGVGHQSWPLAWLIKFWFLAY